jgi:hypothetical protein
MWSLKNAYKIEEEELYGRHVYLLVYGIVCIGPYCYRIEDRPAGLVPNILSSLCGELSSIFARDTKFLESVPLGFAHL